MIFLPTPERTRSLAASAMAFLLPLTGTAEVVLSTDFTGRSVSGKTASNIPWFTNGVADPGDLTWVLEGGGPANTNLFDTANAQDHFAPDLNIENEGPWSVTIPLELVVTQVSLEEVVLGWQHFNNAGAFQGVNRTADWTVSVTGSSSGELASVTATNVNGMSGVETLTFPSPVTLTRSESYALKIFVIGNGPGNNTGLKAVTLLGPVGPAAPFRLAVSQDDDNLVFEWDSKPGMLYNLRSVIDPSSAVPGDWPIFDDQIDIEATPPTNTLTLPRPADPERFFAVEEFPAPPVALLDDDFESGIGEWTTGSDGAAGTAWELGAPSAVGPGASRSPTNCFGTNIAGDYQLDANVWLRSPPIDLSLAPAATLRYWQFTDIEEGFDLATVRVLDAADDSELAVLETNIDGVTADWEEVVHPLPAQALGSLIKLEFLFESDEIGNFAGWYLDDVLLTTLAP